MSQAIHHYTPSELRLLRCQRTRDRQADAMASARPSSAPSAFLGGTSSRGGARRQERPVAPPQAANHKQLNLELLKNMQELNSVRREESKLTELAQRYQQEKFRCAMSAKAQQEAIEQLAAKSPRRGGGIRDMTAETQRDDLLEATHSSHGTIPSYLAKRIAEQRSLRAQREQAAAVRESERAFPVGKEPMNPDMSERAREFLELRLKELEDALRNFPFRLECSLLGQRKKSELESQLRDVEVALAKFQFPVVFVESRKPKPAAVARKPNNKPQPFA